MVVVVITEFRSVVDTELTGLTVTGVTVVGLSLVTCKNNLEVMVFEVEILIKGPRTEFVLSSGENSSQE